MKKLTPLQRRLVEIYVSMRKPNQAKAYILAGYKVRGKTAEQEASRTLKKPQVKAYMKSILKKATEQAEKSAAEVIRELEKLGFSNIKDYLSFDSKGIKLKNSSRMSREQLACISQVSESISKKGTKYIKFSLYDKRAALETLARYHRLFTDEEQSREFHIHIHQH